MVASCKIAKFERPIFTENYWPREMVYGFFVLCANYKLLRLLDWILHNSLLPGYVLHDFIHDWILE